MKTYEICVSFKTYQYHTIEAENDEQAIELAQENEDFKEFIDTCEISIENVIDDTEDDE